MRTVSRPDAAELRLADYASVHGHVQKVCFKTGPPGLVGAELEWLVVADDDPCASVPLPLLQRLLRADDLPGGSRLTFEPGGQVELSSRPLPGPTACWRTLDEDVAHLQRTLHEHGLRLLPTGLDPYRPPRRQLRQARYDAMAAYFDGLGTDHGRVMMSCTAALQVNLDIGEDPAEGARRWRLLHAVGPTLMATFANSRVHNGTDTGWACGRQRVWQQLDPARTAAPVGEDPVAAWTDYALAAPVMLQRRDGADWSAETGLTFGSWMGRDGGPSYDDLELHLTTLFPPVRPRGWFEVRFLDTQSPRWWPVPMAVLASLVEDRAAGDEAVRACAGLDDWTAAARGGHRVPGLTDASVACLDLAARALRRAGEDPALADLVAAFADQYPRRGRAPSDDPVQEAP